MSTTAESVERVPPHDLEAEMALLACLLLAGQDDLDMVAEVRGRVRPDEFYRTAHRHVYEACLWLFEHGEPAAPLLVARELERRGVLAEAGGREWIVSLCSATSTPAHAAHYADQVRDYAIRRRVLHVTTEAATRARDGATGLDLVEQLERHVLELRAQDTVTGPVTAQGIAQAVVAELDRPSDQPLGLSTGLTDLDTLIGGYRSGQLIVVAGRTSMGKTSLALTNVRRACIDDGVPTLFVSLEMGKEEIGKGLLASLAGVDVKHLHDPRFLCMSERAAIREAAVHLEKAPLHVLDASPQDVPSIRSHALRLKLRGGLGLIVVDYIQLVHGVGLFGVNRSTSREQEVAAVSRALKSMAREINVPVVVLAQLNRMAEAREDHRPRLADLRESGAIENDADVALLLFRPEYYAKTDAERASLHGRAEIHVAKQRSGPVGLVPAYFRAPLVRFEDAARGQLEVVR